MPSTLISAPLTLSGLFMVKAVKRRGASEMLGAILVAVITVAMAVAYAGYGLTQAQTQMASISDVLRASARAQRQLLSLSYYYRSGADGKLYAYIYNMGSEVSTLKTVVVGSSKYDMSNPMDCQYVQMKDACTRQSIGNYAIQPKELVELSVTAPAGQLDLLVMTDEGGIFIWRLNL